LSLHALSAPAAFTSLYAFGDGVCTTTNSPGGAIYHGNRYSNGRVWVEVLAQRQGLAYVSNRNWSYFGHYSRNLVTNVNLWTAPPDASTSLLVVWVNNADFVDILADPQISYSSNNIAKWTNAMNASLSNHVTAVSALYAKGVRTIVMPGAVDITKAPYYDFGDNNEAFVRQRIIDYNLAFTNRMLQLSASLANLTIAIPDTFKLFDDLIQTPPAYGLTNSTSYALLEVPGAPLWGAGTNFLFWDYLHPTAKVHEVVADTTQALLTPAQISAVSISGSDGELELANLPVGLSGFVESSTNFLNWTTLTGFNSTNTTQSILVSAAQATWFYRLHFPFVWSWP
jgi:outer membrane lipase/esterase